MKQKIKFFFIEQKEKIYDNVVELVNKVNKKEKYRYHDRDDLDYYGIRDICVIILMMMMMMMMMMITNQYQSKVLSMKTINIMKAEVIKTKNYRQNNILA